MQFLALMLVIFGGCSDNKVGVYNTPPTARITDPVDDDAFDHGVTVELWGLAYDDQDAADVLEVNWNSSVDGNLGNSNPDSDGVAYYAAPELSSGTHAITMTVSDSRGESDVDTVTIVVGQGDDPTAAPTVVLLGPAEGDSFAQTEEIALVGSVTDHEQDCSTLDLSAISSRDGVLWEGYSASNCSVTETLSGLSEGTHQLTLIAQDVDGNTGSDMVEFEIYSDSNPGVMIASPSSGSSHFTVDSILFEGQVNDDMTDNTNLVIEWSSDLDGVLSTATADSQGSTSFSSTLSEGTHVVSLKAWDEDSNLGSDSINLVVEVDTEVCNTVDDDGDGQINEDWQDSFEPNDSVGAPYDLGEVDNTTLPWSTGGDSLEVSGLTLHEPGDEDWFVFDADDEIWDNAKFDVQVTGIPTGVSVVLQLWSNGGSGSLEDSASGNSLLQVSYQGDYFDDGEDDFAVRVYATNWATTACTIPYTLTVVTEEDPPW